MRACVIPYSFRTLSCPLMTELLLLLFRCAPYGGAGRARAPKAVATAAAGGADVAIGGAGAAAAVAAAGSSPWLTIIPQVSLLGGRATTAPFWLSSIVVVVVVGFRGGRDIWQRRRENAQLVGSIGNFLRMMKTDRRLRGEYTGSIYYRFRMLLEHGTNTTYVH